jgi:hypothetical protein
MSQCTAETSPLAMSFLVASMALAESAIATLKYWKDGASSLGHARARRLGSAGRAPHPRLPELPNRLGVLYRSCIKHGSVRRCVQPLVKGQASTRPSGDPERAPMTEVKDLIRTVQDRRLRFTASALGRPCLAFGVVPILVLGACGRHR